MSILGVGAGAVGGTGFYPFEIGQSLRLDGDARLSHSHQSAPTLQTKATVSFWIKLHDNNDRNIVLHTGVGTSNNTHMTLALGASNSYQWNKHWSIWKKLICRFIYYTSGAKRFYKFLSFFNEI